MSNSKNFQYFDAVVIGGGPSGSAAAYTLASGSMSTCLIDKSDFPREKLCGGLVTQRSKKIFESVFHRHWADELLLASSEITFSANGKSLASLGPEKHNTVMYFTMRNKFDAFLVKLAAGAGVTLALGRKVESMNFALNRLVLDNGDEIQFKYLIGADGVNSQVAKTLFGRAFNPKTIPESVSRFPTHPIFV